jgi:hypothetical protein
MDLFRTTFMCQYKTRSSTFLQEHKLTKELIESVIEKFEKWRKSYNGEYTGYGIDYLYRLQKLHYPLAYAFYIRGFVEMYKYTKSQEWLKKTTQTIRILDGIRMDELYCWGLPFPWKGRKNEAYGITTAFAGHAYLDAYEQTHDEEYLVVVKKTIDWIINNLGFSQKKEGICFWYSPRVKKEVLNVSAEILALIARYFKFSREVEKKFRDILQGGYNYIKTRRLSQGLWPYFADARDPLIDFHINYIIEGMYYLSKCGIIPLSQTSKEILQPYTAYTQLLMNKNGSLTLTNTSQKEARLWAYGASLYAGTLVLDFDDKFKCRIYEYIYRILNYALSNLWDSKMGAFYYRYNDHETRYIRHEAHMFYALAKLLNSNEFWKNMPNVGDVY